MLMITRAFFSSLILKKITIKWIKNFFLMFFKLGDLVIDGLLVLKLVFNPVKLLFW